MLSGLLLHRLAKHLANAFVVEKHRYAAFGNEYGDSVAKNESLGMIYLETMSADKFDRKRLERRTLLKSSQGTIEVLCRHVKIIPRSCTSA